LCAWIGIDFYLFARWGESAGAAPFHAHPPGAEGFLPISALMGLKLWLSTGVINEVHPAGLLIFTAVVLISLVARKAFCSWLCPIGTLSESLWMLGQKVFGRNFKLWRWVDYPLRSLKYLLFFFFAYSIWQMDSAALDVFIRSPYNKVADIKMYYFFVHMSTFAVWTIIALMFLSMLVKNFWCRFLCPYGALLGIGALFSPLKVRRNAASCVDCELCTKACPAGIKVHKVKTVWSDECTNCLACVEACPVVDTLDVRTPLVNTRVPSWVLGTLIAGIFIAVTGLGIITGRWQNRISADEYLKRFKNIDSPLYEHNRGDVPNYSPND
jgi:polyferredoxin